MISLILFEFTNFFGRKKNIISIICFCLIIILFIFANNAIQTSKMNLEETVYKEHLQSLQQSLSIAKSKYSENPTIEKLKIIIDSTEANIKLVSDQQNANIKGDWKTELGIQIKLDTKLLINLQEETIFGPDPIEIKNTINKNKILYNEDIKPINENNSMTSYNFIRLLSRDILPLFLVILLFILSADIVSNENEGTFKVLLIQPISRSKVILSKVISISIICIGLIFLTMFIFFISLGLLKGFGSSIYPIEIYTKNVSGINQFITIRKFIAYLLPMLILFIITITSLGILISTLSKDSTSSISSAIIIGIGFNIFISKFNLFKTIVHYIPFTYSNISAVIDGSIIASLQNENVTYGTGIGVMIVSIILCNLTSILVFRKKDITC